MRRVAADAKLIQRVLANQEKALGPEHRDVAVSLNLLARLYFEQGRYAEAEPLAKRALAIWEGALGPEHPTIAGNLNLLARVYADSGRYAEAEPLYKRAVAIWEKAFGPEHPDVAMGLNNLANLYMDEGRYAEAEPLHKRALAIREKLFGAEHPEVAMSLTNLGRLYFEEGRYAEAEPIRKQALAIWEKAFGTQRTEVAMGLKNLARLYAAQGRAAEAEPLYKWALAIWEKVLGPEHPNVAAALGSLASLYAEQGRAAEAEPLYKRALAIQEKAFGPEHPNVAQGLVRLARLYADQGRYAEAEPLVDRATDLLEWKHGTPDAAIRAYQLRAELGWHAKRAGEAVADLRRAMDLAEQLRTQSSGAEHERAEFFGQFSGIFEQMVAWQLELGDMAEVLSAMERAHARSLLDDLRSAGADLNVGRPARQREEMLRRERELKMRVAGLEAQREQAAEDQQRRRLDAELGEAREALYQFYRDQRSSSSVYRNLLASGGGSIRLSLLERQLRGRGGLLLAYLLGEKGGYVLSVGVGKPRVTALGIDAAAAKSLAIDAGPLTAKRVRAALVKADGTGVVQQLSRPRHAAEVAERLSVLWKVLVPEADREAISRGKAKRLVIVPDGPLALLPFETLVLQPGSNPQYLLDVDVPVVYAPSATVLYNLQMRLQAAGPAGTPPVLVVGDPLYPAEAPPGRGREQGPGAAPHGFAISRGGWAVEPAALFGNRSRLGVPGLREARAGRDQAGPRSGHQGQCAGRRGRPPGRTPRLPRLRGQRLRQFLRSAGPGAGKRRREQSGRRWFSHPGRHLPVGPQTLRAGDPQRVRHESRPPAARRGRMGLVARIPGGRLAAGGGQRLARGR